MLQAGNVTVIRGIGREGRSVGVDHWDCPAAKCENLTITFRLFPQEPTVPDGTEMLQAGNVTVIREIGREGRRCGWRPLRLPCGELRELDHYFSPVSSGSNGAGRHRNATSRQCNGNSRNWERREECGWRPLRLPCGELRELDHYFSPVSSGSNGAGRHRNATSRQCNGNSRNWERGEEVWVTTIKIALRQTARTWQYYFSSVSSGSNGFEERSCTGRKRNGNSRNWVKEEGVPFVTTNRILLWRTAEKSLTSLIFVCCFRKGILWGQKWWKQQ